LKKRIGLLGGTFDPIHFGHLQLAELALKRCDLHQVIFIPAASPPHKNMRVVSDFKHRAKMVALAIAGKKDFGLSTIEAKLSQPSYTIDTLKKFVDKQKQKEELFFILGEDAFLEIKSWKAYKDLPSLTNFIISGRPGYSPENFQSVAQSLGYVRKEKTWLNASGTSRLFFLPTETADISSSKVRKKIKQNSSLQGILPENIVEYIRKHRLYLEEIGIYCESESGPYPPLKSPHR
jgi:nicotinate-nucleotide adenylyltransferase